MEGSTAPSRSIRTLGWSGCRLKSLGSSEGEEPARRPTGTPLPRHPAATRGRSQDSAPTTAQRAAASRNHGAPGPERRAEDHDPRERTGRGRSAGSPPSVGTEPEGAGPSAPCSPVSAAWRAPRNTCSRCSFTQPRVLRRLERKPTAAAISGSMSALLSALRVWLLSRAWAVSDWTGCPGSPLSLRRPSALPGLARRRAFQATARGGVAAGPGGGAWRPPRPARSPPPPFALRSSPADVSASNTSCAFQAPARGGGAGGGGHWPAARRGRGLYQPCPRALAPAAPASAAPAALRSSPVTSVLGTRAPRAGRGSRGKGDRERPGSLGRKAARQAGRGLTSPLLPSFHTA